MVTYLGLLVQLCCGEGGTLQTNIPGVCWGVLAVYGPHWVCPSSQCICFPSLHCSGSRLLRRGTVQLSKARPAFSALSKCKPHRFSGTPQGHKLGWARVLCPSQIQAAQATKYLVSTMCLNHLPGPSHSVSQGHHKSSLRCLLWGADLKLQPSWKMSTIQDPRKTWLATGILLTV